MMRYSHLVISYETIPIPLLKIALPQICLAQVVLSKTTICSIDELLFAFYNAIYKNKGLFFERMLCEVF